MEVAGKYGKDYFLFRRNGRCSIVDRHGDPVEILDGITREDLYFLPDDAELDEFDESLSAEEKRAGRRVSDEYGSS